MSKQTDREKLARLIDKICGGVMGYTFRSREAANLFLADNLLSHGVTLDNQVSSSKWIPVEEGLPEKGQQFLCIWEEDGRIYDGYRSDSFYDDFIISGFSYVNIHFSHWMPLPEPPEMKGE